jgi:serine/threonine protein kinase
MNFGDEYTIIHELGKGIMGSTYLLEDKFGNKFAGKMQHINDEDIDNPSSKINREIEFSKFTSAHPNRFMKLVSYKFIDNCTYVHEANIVFKMTSEEQENYDKVQSSKMCVQLIYELKDGTLKTIFTDLTSDQKYSLIIQLAYICKIMSDAGYRQNDITPRNIMFNKVPIDQTIDILGYNVPTYGYVYCLIDYGEIMNVKFGFSNEQEKYDYENTVSDFDEVVYDIFRNEPVWKETRRRGVYVDIIKEEVNKQMMKETDIYDDVKKFFVPDKRETNNIMLNNVFFALNPKRYYDIIGVTKYIDNIEDYIVEQPLSTLDYLYMATHTGDLEKIIRYFAKKLKI